MSLQRSEEYRRKAEEAERRAANAKAPATRRAFEDVAKGWRELQARAERLEAPARGQP